MGQPPTSPEPLGLHFDEHVSNDIDYLGQIDIEFPVAGPRPIDSRYGHEECPRIRMWPGSLGARPLCTTRSGGLSMVHPAGKMSLRVSYRLRGMKRWGILLSGSVGRHDPWWLPAVGLAAEDCGVRLEE